MRVPFSKYEGLGNDFAIVEHAVDRDAAIAWCDRHRGIGADGVLILSQATPSSVFHMRVINADGSVPEMCGNGIRCVALHLSRTGRAPLGEAFEISTDAGPHICRVIEPGDNAARAGLVEVMMRHASLQPAEIGLDSPEPFVDAPIALGDGKLRITAVSMGNPHAVTFDDVGERRLELGPRVEKHALFARGVNAGFARMTGAQTMDLRVFERGSGWTQACGTGACAAAVAAVETGRTRRHEPLEVRLPGGPLTITVGEHDERICMTGPARYVFAGEV
jgi:diaminopimelate epimerase